jgi:hypothetical protein
MPYGQPVPVSPTRTGSRDAPKNARLANSAESLQVRYLVRQCRSSNDTFRRSVAGTLSR